ncbi:serine hydrolase [Geodermatophilaceae bacterium NBWT11]|nr:serine hydrolase [Geodermatophilaceae bacterium NBWT11]
MSRPLEVADLADLELPGDPAIAPDGRTVVYVLRTTDTVADADRRSLWVVRADGDGWAAPARLTSGPADTAPAFSPDGNSLAFLRGGDDPAQLHVLPMAGGEAECVTGLPLGAGRPVWSPDGSRIAFTAPVRSGPEPEGPAAEHAPLVTGRLDHKADGSGRLGTVRAHLHVLDRDSGEVAQLTTGDWHAGPPAWSPDGTRLAFAAATDADADRTGRSAVHLVPVDGGAPHRVGPTDGVAGPVLWVDAGTLLVAGQQAVEVGHTQLLRVPLDGGPVEDLAAALDRNVMPGGPGYPGGLPQLTPDGTTVVFCIRDRGCSHVHTTAVDGTGTPRPLVTGDDVVASGLAVASGAAVAAVVLADPDTFGEVAVVPLAGGPVTRLTRHTAQSLPDVVLLRPEPRTSTVHDGTQVHGWLLRDPAAVGPGPLLVDVHGGPHNAWSPAADAVHPYHQVLASRGWSVLLLNIRGSDGYGQAAYRSAVGRWGLADERDVLDPLDELVAEGVADPDRLALTGYSYGGYLTCWLTGRTDRFAAAVAGGVVADLRSQWGTSDVGTLLGGLEWPDPVTEPAALAEIDPWTRVGEVTTPTLVLHGADDQRCPVGQAEQWFTALRSRGVPTELVLYPGASHLFVLDGRPSHRADYSHRILDWTERHVTTTPARTQAQERPQLDTAHWQQRLDELAAGHQVPGATLAVLRLGVDGADDELAEAATGVLNTATGVEVTTDSVFQIGSISKVWTATLVMQLVEEGRLDLDAPLVEVLPDLALGDPDVAERVTMRHLLTHTSGIDGDVFTDTGRGDDVLERYVAALADVAQNHPLGATFSYCNSGYSLAGRVVEVLTGKTWDTVLRERVVEPLGLTRTSTLPEEAILHRAAVGHVSEGPDQPFTPVSTFLLPRSAGPAGLINASARDVTAFARAHLQDGGPLVSAATAADMQAAHAELPDTHTLGDSWGLGWIRFDWHGERLYGHDGSTFGQNAYLRVLPGAGLVVALLTNGGHSTDLFRALVGEVVSELAGVTMADQLVPPAPAPDLELGRYVGTYERSSMRTEVTERDGSLVLRMVPTGPLADAPGHAPEEMTLHPVADGLFCAQPPGQESWMAVTFYALPDGAEYVHYGVRANPRVG